jgi:type I restriction-modification system DNA methylase subunit
MFLLASNELQKGGEFYTPVYLVRISVRFFISKLSEEKTLF